MSCIPASLQVWPAASSVVHVGGWRGCRRRGRRAGAAGCTGTAAGDAAGCAVAAAYGAINRGHG
eukprot:5151855-Pyramimonas_sp.AAC.1